MTGVASWDCSQPTGGEAGGEIRNCFSGFGGSSRGLPICTDCTKEEELKEEDNTEKDKRNMTGEEKVEVESEEVIEEEKKEGK